MWMKLQTKRISPKENLICTHLKYKLAMHRLADEVCHSIYIMEPSGVVQLLNYDNGVTQLMRKVL